jgi:hypothetical protein
MLCLIVFGFAYTLDKDGAIYAVVFLLSAQENQKLLINNKFIIFGLFYSWLIPFYTK